MCFYHSGVQQTAKLATTLLLTGLLTTGCGPSNTRANVVDKSPTVRAATSDDSVEAMILGFDDGAAISILDNAALNSNREKAFALLVRAAELAINHESKQAVDQRQQVLIQRYPDIDKTVKLAILNNRILLARKQTENVLGSLDALLLLATPQEKLSIRALKAEALQQAGFPIESVQLRIALDQDYQRLDRTKQSENDALLWNSLMRVPPDLVSGHISEIPDTFSGWLELAHIAHRHKFDSNALNAGIDSWRVRNPGHPANRELIQRIKTKQLATSQLPTHISLVVPLSGKLAPVGKAVRDGFMSAYLESSRLFGAQMTIDVYDTQGTAEGAAQAVRIANNRGSQFIVGPLNKEAVTAAISANQPMTATPGKPATTKTATPVAIHTRADILTLNRATGNLLDDTTIQLTDTSNAPRLYQFDLAPENEARQVAERASLEGLDYAMVMVPENVWGNRIYEAFTRRYQELGGEVIALQRFKKGATDYSSGIQQGLRLDRSNARHRQLKSLLHEDIEFTPRRRQDIDMVFIAASPQEARLIKPQLKFFYADDIPVYATSSIYSGTPNPGRDKDLENIRFCDMPWLITDKPAPGSLQRLITTSWPQESAKYLRFYALGADAFQLIPQLDWLKNNHQDWIAGGTGRLSLNSDGVVQRHLSWASFKHAVPEPDSGFSN